MSPSTDLLSLNSVKLSSQTIETNDNSLAEGSPGGRFAEILGSTPAGIDQGHAESGGDALPPGGSGLPEAAVPIEPEVVSTDLLPLENTVSLSPGNKSAPDAELAPQEATEAEAFSQAAEDPLVNVLLPEVSTNIPLVPVDVGAGDGRNSESVASASQQLRSDLNPLLQSRNVGERNGAPIVTTELAVNSEKQPSLDNPLAPIGRERVGTDEALLRLQRGLNATGLVAPGSEVLSVGESGDITLKGGVQLASPTSMSGAYSAPLIRSESLSSPPGATSVLTTNIEVPVTDKSWGNALNDRVMWLTGQKIQNAEIRLNPAELGPLRVTVTVQDDVAQLSFNASHATTREAIEQAMPRLREMLSENGLSLGESSVSDGEGTDLYSERQADEGGSDTSDADAGLSEGEEALATPVQQLRSSALVDTFA